LLCPQKNFTPQQKNAPALRQAVGSHSPHFATLHCGLSVSATLAPLAVGSRLSTTQAKKSLRYRYADFLPAPFRLKAVLPALFLASPTPAPNHPPLKTVEFFILFTLPRRILGQ
jgi:hypothetical protein